MIEHLETVLEEDKIPIATNNNNNDRPTGNLCIKRNLAPTNSSDGESPTETDGLEELSKTPTNKNSSNDSITETSQTSTETFQQRKEEAESRRRKKKKTNSSVVASTFQDLYHMTGEILGQGAYASVRTCRNIWTDQEFAVKIIDK